MRHGQVKAPMRRYRTPPEGSHDWLKASSPAVWVYTPALPALSHGYKSKSTVCASKCMRWRRKVMRRVCEVGPYLSQRKHCSQKEKRGAHIFTEEGE